MHTTRFAARGNSRSVTTIRKNPYAPLTAGKRATGFPSTSLRASGMMTETEVKSGEGEEGKLETRSQKLEWGKGGTAHGWRCNVAYGTGAQSWP